jgi:hypothetical protein
VTTGLAWVSIAIFAAAMVTMYEGEYGPDVNIGWPNRLVIVTYCLWIMSTAALAAKADRPAERATPSRA